MTLSDLLPTAGSCASSSCDVPPLEASSKNARYLNGKKMEREREMLE